MKYPVLKDRLKWLGMTQAQVAAKLHINYGRFNLMMVGRNYLPVEVAIGISKIVGKSVEELFSEVQEEEKQ